MEAIIIKSENIQNLKLLAELARKLGEQVTSINEAQTEDFLFGKLMEQEKTGKEVSREEIMAKLRS